MPKAACSFGYASDRKNIYVMGGLSYNQHISFPLVYSFAGGEWAILKFNPPLKNADYAPAAEFIPGLNSIIVIGEEIDVIDTEVLSNHLIKVEGEFPKYMGSAVWENQLYLFGGSYGTFASADGFQEVFSDKLFVFNSTTGILSELPPLSSTRITWGKIIDGKLYTFGGTHGTTRYNDISYYDIHLNSWKFIGLLPHPISNCSIASDDRFIYLMGVDERLGFLGIFNPTDNSYTEYKTNLSFSHGGLVVRDNKAFYFGGETLTGYYEMNNHLFEFDLKDLPK